jgi:hypothetical protein
MKIQGSGATTDGQQTAHISRAGRTVIYEIHSIDATLSLSWGELQQMKNIRLGIKIEELIELTLFSQ